MTIVWKRVNYVYEMMQDSGETFLKLRNYFVYIFYKRKRIYINLFIKL